MHSTVASAATALPPSPPQARSVDKAIIFMRIFISSESPRDAEPDVLQLMVRDLRARAVMQQGTEQEIERIDATFGAAIADQDRPQSGAEPQEGAAGTDPAVPVDVVPRTPVATEFEAAAQVDRHLHHAVGMPEPPIVDRAHQRRLRGKDSAFLITGQTPQSTEEI